MGIKEFLDIVKEFFSLFWETFVITFTSSQLNFAPEVTESQIHTSKPRFRINHQLFIFLVLCVFIGSTLNSVILGRSEKTNFQTIIVFTLAIWVLYSVSIYLLAKIFSKQTSFIHIFSISLQLLGVFYVSSNALAVILSILIKIFFFSGRFTEPFRTLLANPFLIYYLLHLLFMGIYLPHALKSNGVNLWGRLFITILVPIFWSLFGIIILASEIAPSLLKHATSINPTPIPIPARSTQISSTFISTAQSIAMQTTTQAYVADAQLLPTVLLSPTPTVDDAYTTTPASEQHLVAIEAAVVPNYDYGDCISDLSDHLYDVYKVTDAALLTKVRDQPDTEHEKNSNVIGGIRNNDLIELQHSEPWACDGEYEWWRIKNLTTGIDGWIGIPQEGNKGIVFERKPVTKTPAPPARSHE